MIEVSDELTTTIHTDTTSNSNNKQNIVRKF